MLLVRTNKPWVIPAQAFEKSKLSLSEIANSLQAAVIVAKPSNNLYLGKPIGTRLDCVCAGIVNLASHGEMAIQQIVHNGTSDSLSDRARRLINVLPTKVQINSGAKVGDKGGKFLNHFGYRKVVMNLVPESLEDHAWVANALSYSTSRCLVPDFMFDPTGGGIAGGIAAQTLDGAIFRGSGIADSEGVIVSPEESLQVSLLANNISSDPKSLVLAKNEGELEFRSHRFFARLRAMLVS
jgi:hypothetical protein